MFLAENYFVKVLIPLKGVLKRVQDLDLFPVYLGQDILENVGSAWGKLRNVKNTAKFIYSGG